MNNSMIFSMVLLISCIATPASSFDICEEGAKALVETHSTFDTYFNNYLKDHNAEGRNEIYEVYATDRSSVYEIIMDCGNNVLLRAESNSGGLKDLKIGQEVKFSGNVERWSRRFYPGINKRYVIIDLGDSSISY